MLVNFHLRPAADVRAWEPSHALHWLGLSDGWYWLEVSGVELFRYSPALLSRWGVDVHVQPHLVYAEWFLADFWNYLLDDLPTFLTPIPGDLAALLADDHQWHEWDRLATQESDPKQGDTTSDPAEYEEVHDVATRWWHARQMDSAWLRHAPGIWLWRVADTMHLRWDCRMDTEDGVPVWAATTGMHTMAVSTFLAEVRGFHARFMQAMEERIKVARSGWPRPDIRLDIDQLEQGQVWRSGYLTEVLASEADETEWESVREAINRLGHLKALRGHDDGV